ncbi:MAG TPA: SDR family NAD(P)-dependent oxidoreductase, partial [Methylomirabilota bacterium]|nr:SDR family NAD(P)-dependent oxidoreductase [Methylomirabilota bacterium]
MSRTVLITGGAGFIGSNAARAFLESGDRVRVFDNLARKGAEVNLRWLRTAGPFELVRDDLRNFEAVAGALEKGPVDLVLHLAGQVAVTTSVADPREDFEINALGSFNLLEAVRRSGQNPVVIYASTNKVYGGLPRVGIVERDGRYGFRDLPEGIPETWPLDFHSPYGCSKGAADQYFLDYARIYGLRTVVFRQSCIYGYRQFGVEDQGWVAWFAIAAALGRPITVYGDGKQVRDVLFIDDLIAAFRLAAERIEVARG